MSYPIIRWYDISDHNERVYEHPGCFRWYWFLDKNPPGEGEATCPQCLNKFTLISVADLPDPDD